MVQHHAIKILCLCFGVICSQKKHFKWVVWWCWVNFQCRGILQIWIREGQGPTALAVGAGGGCLDIFSLIYQISQDFLSPSLWETAWYRLKYCLKGLISPKQSTNQAWYFHVTKQCYLPVHIYNQIISFKRPAKLKTKFWIAFKHRAKWWKWSKYKKLGHVHGCKSENPQFVRLLIGQQQLIF